jgi:hydrogenase 3 maturation protease
MNLLLTVGNGMMGDDGAGVLLAQKLRENPISGWSVVNGGSAPENTLHQVRELEPERVLVVDAADMDLEPGSIRLIQAEKLDDPFLMTTHSLPLSYLVDALQEFVGQVELLGIQPDTIAFGFPMSEAVRGAVGQIYLDLQNGVTRWDACN